MHLRFSKRSSDSILKSISMGTVLRRKSAPLRQKAKRAAISKFEHKDISLSFESRPSRGSHGPNLAPSLNLLHPPTRRILIDQPLPKQHFPQLGRRQVRQVIVRSYEPNLLSTLLHHPSDLKTKSTGKPQAIIMLTRS